MDREVLKKITYGLYIVSSMDGDRINGQIANTVFQITSEPVSIAISINKENLTHEFIEKSGLFSVSVLSTDATMDLIGKFGFKSGREQDKFSEVEYSLTSEGLPVVLEESLAYLTAQVTDEMDAGTHTIFLGAVTGAEILVQGEPMTYAYYHTVKKGKTPKAAPTYISQKKKEDEPAMSAKDSTKYVCTLCGYVYDPEKGDPYSEIPPNTPFSKLPDDWECPLCGAGKDEFEVQEEE